MTPNWGELREWKPDTLEDAASLLKQRRNTWEGLSDDLTGANPEGWHGDAATAAHATRRDLEGC